MLLSERELGLNNVSCGMANPLLDVEHDSGLYRQSNLTSGGNGMTLLPIGFV